MSRTRRVSASATAVPLLIARRNALDQDYDDLRKHDLLQKPHLTHSDERFSFCSMFDWFVCPLVWRHKFFGTIVGIAEHAQAVMREFGVAKKVLSR